MQKVLVIVAKNGVKYQIGSSKSVAEVVNEVSSCKSDFYQVHENCAIKVDEITSIESYVIKEVEEEDEAKSDNS